MNLSKESLLQMTVPPCTRVNLTDLLNLSVKLHASDLHLSPNMPPMIRLEGDLTPIKDRAPLDAHTIKHLIDTCLSEEQQHQFEKNLEIDFAIEVPSVARYRVNVFHQTNGIAAVFRVIPEVIPSLEHLGLPPIIKKVLDLPNGLVLVTGPTGCGKSTTLASMVDYINQQQACHIITIEDPIEFTHASKKSLVNQREVHRDTHDFATALRSALRQDPDVILVGEMRDLETIRLCLTAAETGHLILATLHTSSAPRTINRIIDVFPAAEKNMIRNMLSESLQAVLCQTLLKKIGGGQVAAFEIMLATPAIRNLIREDKIPQMVTAMQTGGELGMCTLDQSLQTLLNKGIIMP
jgi:twitching motility protein PilT